MPDTPETQTVRSQRNLKRLESLLRMSGLSGIPPDSDAGRVLRKRAEQYLNVHNGKLPDEMVERLIQLAVETEILKDAAFAWLTKLRPPKSTDPQKLILHQKLYSAASSAYRAYSQLLMSIMKTLSGEGDGGGTDEKVEDRIRSLADKHGIS